MAKRTKRNDPKYFVAHITIQLCRPVGDGRTDDEFLKDEVLSIYNGLGEYGIGPIRQLCIADRLDNKDGSPMGDPTDTVDGTERYYEVTERTTLTVSRAN